MYEIKTFCANATLMVFPHRFFTLYTPRCRLLLLLASRPDIFRSGVLSLHNHTLTSAANKSLGCVGRTDSVINNVKVRRTPYLAVVHPHLGYATQVWSPQSIDLVRRVERVQRCATNVIVNVPFKTDITYKQRLNSLHLLPISYWHEFLDLVFFFKIVHNITNMNSEIKPTQHIPMRSTRNTSDSVSS